ncbi:MAG: acyltransferase [Nitrosomonas sp.]|nr:acyltransferase [Nitrosomonas sp.]
MNTESSKFYIPSLDGIRAVAAMLVFVSHAGWSHIIPGGFGVTIFFFLSGYLITTLLRREFEKQGLLILRISICGAFTEYFPRFTSSCF